MKELETHILYIRESLARIESKFDQHLKEDQETFAKIDRDIISVKSVGKFLIFLITLVPVIISLLTLN